jgi:hypothetical protein
MLKHLEYLEHNVFHKRVHHPSECTTKLTRRVIIIEYTMP